MSAILVVAVLLLAPVQVTVSTVLFREPLAAPVLPAMLIAAWAAVRRPEETWPAILLPAVVLGAMSEQRVGWFLLALLPAPLIASIAAARFRPRITGLTRRALVAGAAASGGAAAYGLVLLVGAGMAGETTETLSSLVASSMLTGTLALVATLGLWPLRPRQRGLFE